MKVYNYIAETNPDEAFEICKKYGFFRIEDTAEMAMCLERIVASEGEPAFKEIMCLHPDKDALIELFGREKKKNADGEPAAVATSANNTNTQGSGIQVNQTNAFILAGAVLIAFAILSNK